MSRAIGHRLEPELARSSAACRGCALAGGRFRNAGTRLLLPQALSETPSS